MPAIGGSSAERRLPGDVFTIQDVAAYLKLPVSTAYRLVERRRLPGCKVGRQWRFHKGALEDWFRRQANSRHVSILVVDDEPRIRELFSSSLHDEHRSVLTAASGEKALAMARHTEFDVVLLGLGLRRPRTDAGSDGGLIALACHPASRRL